MNHAMYKYVVPFIAVLVVGVGFFLSRPKFGNPEQIIINEICTFNKNVIANPNGEYLSWIELHNNGTLPVNLEGCYLSNDSGRLDKWAFPTTTVYPGGLQLVFMQSMVGNNPVRLPVTSAHFERPWEFVVNQTALRPDWMTINSKSFPFMQEASRAQVTLQKKAFFYARKSFEVFDLGQISLASLKVDLPVSRISINGQEIFPNDPEWCLQQARPSGKFNLKDYLKTGTNTIAVEIFNSNSQGMKVKLANLKFSIQPKNQSLWMPQHIPHTNFNISKKQSTIYLLNPALDIIDRVVVPALKANHSYGTTPETDSSFAFFTKPTPGFHNTQSDVYSGYVKKTPKISPSPGFYDAPFMAEISSDHNIIRYTLDGSEPDDNSPEYTGPIMIDSTTVVRARGFEPTKITGKTTTNTYFIGESTKLPVFAISTNPSHLFDPVSGIYVTGPYVNYRVINDFMSRSSNFFLDNEIPVHMALFSQSPDTLLFQQDMGLKIHGDYARVFPQRSFQLLARAGYGKATVDYPLFPDKKIHKFKRFILRNAGDEFAETHFRDGLINKLVRNTHLDIMDFAPVVVFINGEYWGLMNLRERISKYYLRENHGVNPMEAILLDGKTMMENELFTSLADFVVSKNMQHKDHYNHVLENLDIENFCDYFIIQSYINNQDNFPGNIKCWKPSATSGKWRFILFDTDDGFGGLDRDSPATNRLDMIMNSEALKIDVTVNMYNALLLNESFKNYFVLRYLDLINTIFSPDHIKKLILEIRDNMAPEIPRHIGRWQAAAAEDVSKIISYEQWHYEVDSVLIPFIEERPAYELTHLQQTFQLKKQVEVTLNSHPLGGGIIRINTIVPDTLPWKGSYFQGLAITVTSHPNPGYRFSHWEGALTGIRETETIVLTGSASVIAHFIAE